MLSVRRLLSLLAVLTLALAGVLTAPVAAAHAAETRTICNYDWVRVRAGATTASAELGRLTRGTVVSGVQQGSWFRLDNGRYVASYYTCTGGAPAPAAAPQASGGQTRVVCNHDWVRIRARATTASAELGRLTRGTVISGTQQGSWFRLADGRYVAASYTCAAPAGAIASNLAAPTALGSSAQQLQQPTGTLGSPTGAFGERIHPITGRRSLHNGIDLGNRSGEPVVAAEAGIVTVVGRTTTAGLYIKIDHGTVNGVPQVVTAYLHLSETAVQQGAYVTRGQFIGRVGNTGSSTKPHLHFTVYESGVPVNPEKWLGPRSDLPLCQP